MAGRIGDYSGDDDADYRPTILPRGWKLNGCLALDPWLFAVSNRELESVRVPLFMLTTQSMMYPENANLMEQVMRRGKVPASASTGLAVFAEVADTRHQDMSDAPSVAYYACRLLCMTSARSPAQALRDHCDAVMAFLNVSVPGFMPSKSTGGSGKGVHFDNSAIVASSLPCAVFGHAAPICIASTANRSAILAAVEAQRRAMPR